MNQSSNGTTGPTVARPRRRSWRLSVRGLMVLVLVVGGVLGWKARRASVQRRAVETIKAAGGMVAYDYQTLPNDQYQLGASPPTPRWIRERLGDELFQEVVAVRVGDYRRERLKAEAESLAALPGFDRLCRLTLFGFPLRDPELTRLTTLSSLEALELFSLGWNQPDQFTALPPLQAMTRLTSLRISPSPTDDAGLRFLRGLDSLNSVDLEQTEVTDASLAVLVPLPKLGTVKFDGSKLTDAGLAELAKIRSLGTLHLLTPGRTALYTDQRLAHLSKISYLSDLAIDATNITAAGYQVLRGDHLFNLHLTGLSSNHEDLVRLVGRQSHQMLKLSGSGMTDEWLRYLSAPALQLGRLELNDTNVTDAGMAQIVKHSLLQNLALDATALTDAGLLRLAAAPALRSISARGTKVTPAGVAAFLAVHPAVAIEIGPLPPK